MELQQRCGRGTQRIGRWGGQRGRHGGGMHGGCRADGLHVHEAPAQQRPGLPAGVQLAGGGGGGGGCRSCSVDICVCHRRTNGRGRCQRVGVTRGGWPAASGDGWPASVSTARSSRVGCVARQPEAGLRGLVA